MKDFFVDLLKNIISGFDVNRIYEDIIIILIIAFCIFLIIKLIKSYIKTLK